MLQLAQLKYFTEIAKQKSINKAAESLYINQPSLSKSIKSLENELGMSLLVRSAKGINLTLFGEEFLDIAKKILDLVDSSYALAEKYNLQEKQNISLDIYLDPYVEEIIFAQRAVDFIKAYPNVRLNIKNIDPQNIFSALKNNEIQVAIINVFPAVLQKINEEEFQYIPILNSETYFLFNEGCNLTQFSKLSIHDVENSKVHPIYTPLLFAKDYNLDYALNVNNLSTIFSILQNINFGLTIPGFAVNYFENKDKSLIARRLYDISNVTTMAVINKENEGNSYIYKLLGKLFPSIKEFNFTQIK